MKEQSLEFFKGREYERLDTYRVQRKSFGIITIIFGAVFFVVELYQKDLDFMIVSLFLMVMGLGSLWLSRYYKEKMEKIK